MKRIGIILIDELEIIIYLYEVSKTGELKLLQSENRDLANSKSLKILKSSDIIEVIAETSFAGYEKHITEWKICARTVPDNIIKDVELATNTTIENLTPAREQEILCRGLLAEFQFRN